ncbi:hypothetical protein Ancab_020867 [Ancistrocladus abbreviatus]
MGEEKRHQMMQNLFGDQSEDEDEDEEFEEDEEEGLDSHHHRHLYDDREGELVPKGEGEVEVESVEEPHEIDPDPGESDEEPYEVDPDPRESDGEREHNLLEREVHDQTEESEREEVDSDEAAPYDVNSFRSSRQEAFDCGGERSLANQYSDNEDEVDQTKRLSRSSSEEPDQNPISHPIPVIRDVFGDSDEEDPIECVAQNDSPQESNSPLEEEVTYQRNNDLEGMIAGDAAQYVHEGVISELKLKEKPLGPPLELEIPLRLPLGPPDKMNIIRVSNIMGVEPKPFDLKTYVEEDSVIAYESGSQRRIRLENNIVRWRVVENPGGTKSFESNARFVRWSDGSLQLLIGNEVLDISVQDAQHDQSHLFLRHGKGILQSKGRLLRKIRFMPSSLSSKSHKLLTALVDSRHKKVFKVKNCITEIDPEREKEEKEKFQSQRSFSWKSSDNSSRKRVDELSDSEGEESEYESDEIAEEMSPPRQKSGLPYQEEEQDEALEEEAGVEVSEEEQAEDLKRSGESRSSLKRKEIESEEESPPRKITAHRRMRVVYDSEEE